MRAAAADLGGTVMARLEQATRSADARALIGQIGKIARAVTDEAGLRWRDITVVAVGSPGVFPSDGDHPSLAHNLPGWTQAGILDAVRAELATHVLFENDVDLAAVGEAMVGQGRNVSPFVYLHVGTGAGMGIVIDGTLFRGATGAAGEIGFLPLAAADPHDPANRRRGALESAISGAAVVRAARAAGMRRRGMTAADVFGAAREGDGRALGVVDEIGTRIGLALAAIAPVLDPALVILGGGVGRNELLLAPIRRELAALSPITPPVVLSELGEDAELTGAVSMALGVAQERLFTRTGTGTKGRIAV
jgi:predicted NBD/HSP70 family sugar kinase